MSKHETGSDIWGKERLELAVYLKNNILNHIKNKWFIENGTLLGAWRTGKFIAHDDDFDLAMLVDSKAEMIEIFQFIKSLLISKYKVRFVNTYACKLEIFEEKHGKYILLEKKYNNSDFYYVTVDIQFYVKYNENLYKNLYFVGKSNIVLFNRRILLPLSSIILEHQEFNAPHLIEEFLKLKYGCLDKHAKYNSKTGLYEKSAYV